MEQLFDTPRQEKALDVLPTPVIDIEPLKCTVLMDDVVSEVCSYFDYQFEGESVFRPPTFAAPNDFSIGLIVGPSGSGKSTLLRQFGQEETVSWDSRRAVVSHFLSASDARQRLGAVGLNTIPSWVKPYHVLSTGERFRADLARRIKSGAVIDEFTSVVDRNVAKACSVALRRYADRNEIKRVVLASCHYDIIEWLQPDWVFDTATGAAAGRRAESRPPISLDIDPCGAEEWAAFSPHHYLTGKINPASHCWLATWGGVPVAFAAALAFPNANFSNAWRGHRTVVLPDFQGLGIGVAVSNAVAGLFVARGCRYFSKTAHPRLGEYRNTSPLWRPTSKNGMSRRDYAQTKRKTKEDRHKHLHINRVCYSHEFIGFRSLEGGG